MFARALAPGQGLGVGQQIAHQTQAAGADRRAGDGTTAFVVRPGDVQRIDVGLFNPGMGHRSDGLRLVVLGAADPGHAVTGLLDYDLADILEQGRLVFGAQQRPVAATQGA
ncbi:hypothetical protein D3C71_1687240 [compost metagenome]